LVALASPSPANATHPGHRDPEHRLRATTQGDTLSAQQVLTWVTEAEVDPFGRLTAYRRLLLLHVVAEMAIAFLRWRDTGLMSPLIPVLLVVSVIAAAMSFVPRVQRFAAPIAAGVLVFSIVRFFPNLANHTFFLLLALLPFVAWNLDRTEERHLALGTLRWTAAIVLFSTGVQKVLYGTYFHGEFLAFQIAHGERFADFFRFVVPGEEIARLKALGAAAGALPGAEGMRAYVTQPPSAGAGPYRLESPVALAAVNLVWIFELVAPVLLLWRKTRTAAAVAIALFLVTIELGALELMFGVLFTGTVLLFFRRNVMGVLLPVYGAVYVYFIGVHLEVFPRWFFFN
jgi:hypothetical protein